MKYIKIVFSTLMLFVSFSVFSQTVIDNEIYIQNKTFDNGDYDLGTKFDNAFIGSNVLPESKSGPVVVENGSYVRVGVSDNGESSKMVINPDISIKERAGFELFVYYGYPTGTERYGDTSILYYGEYQEGLIIRKPLEINKYVLEDIGGLFCVSNIRFNSQNGNIDIGYPVYNNCKLNVSGDFQGARFLTTSDVRLKSKIKPLHNCNNKLLRLSGKTYNKKIDGKIESKEIGLIAQDVTDVLPDVVSKDQSGFLSVDYLSLVPLIIEAIKEQQETIDDNQKKLDEISF